jgi:bacterioferritin
MMKGNERIIAKLNERLKDELAAINQYFLHAEMCEDWGFLKLHEIIEKRAIEEMKHAEALIARILFLEGMPTVSELGAIKIGKSVEQQFHNDASDEKEAVDGYNEGVRLATEVGDNGTKELFESLLRDEEEHLDWIEAQMDLIEQAGLQNYLSQQF